MTDNGCVSNFLFNLMYHTNALGEKDYFKKKLSKIFNTLEVIANITLFLFGTTSIQQGVESRVYVLVSLEKYSWN